jgi:hypothetical protein
LAQTGLGDQPPQEAAGERLDWDGKAVVVLYATVRGCTFAIIQSSRRIYGMGLKVAAIYQDKAET